MIARYKESDRNVAYSESPTNVVEKKLHPVPRMNHSKDRILEHAPWPNFCMNLEDQSPVGGKEYR